MGIWAGEFVPPWDWGARRVYSRYKLSRKAGRNAGWGATTRSNPQKMSKPPASTPPRAVVLRVLGWVGSARAQTEQVLHDL